MTTDWQLWTGGIDAAMIRSCLSNPSKAGHERSCRWNSIQSGTETVDPLGDHKAGSPRKCQLHPYLDRHSIRWTSRKSGELLPYASWGASPAISESKNSGHRARYDTDRICTPNAGLHVKAILALWKWHSETPLSTGYREVARQRSIMASAVGSGCPSWGGFHRLRRGDRAGFHLCS